MPAPPLVVGVAELRRRPGSRRSFDVDVELPGLGLSSSRVPDGAALSVHLRLESLPDGLTATGHIDVPWVSECRRCLSEVRGESRAEVREVFEPHPVEGETYPLRGDSVDLEPMVRDAALLVLPLAPLCTESCAGPAPEVFPTRSEDGPDEGDGVGGAEDGTAEGDRGTAPRDPRWAALDDLRFDDPE